jgi:hypothetical protein
MAPTRTIDAPSAGSVPDGTTATAGNMGIDGVSTVGSPTMEWVTLADGRRGVEITANNDGDSARLDIIDRADAIAATYNGFAFDLLYDNSGAGVSLSDDSVFWAFYCYKNSVVDPGGSPTQLVFNFRYFDDEARPPAVDGQRGVLRLELDSRQDIAGDNSESGLGNYIYPGVVTRFGFHWVNDASDGSIDAFINGHRIASATGCDTAFLDGGGALLNRFRTRDRAGEKTTIIYPIEVYEDEDGRDDMKVDRTDADESRARLFLEEPVVDGSGVWEQESGTLEVGVTYPFGGLGPRRGHFDTSGTGSAVVKLRAEQAIGAVPEIAPGRYLISAGNFQVPAGESVTARLGMDAEDDLFGFVLDSSAGTTTTRQLKRWISGAVQIDTGIDYSSSRWVAVYYALNTSEIDTSYIVLIDMSEEVNNQRKVWVYDLPFTSPASLEMNHLVYEFSGPGIRAEFPFVFDTDTGLGLPSSWVGGDTPLTPIFQSNNNIALSFPHVPEPATPKALQQRFFMPHVLGDGGRRMLDFRAAMGGDYTTLRAFAGVFLFFVESAVNDLTQGATIAAVVDEWSDLIDAAVTYGVKIVYTTNPKIPDFSPTQAANAALIDAGVLALMQAKDRPDLLFYADMPGNSSQAEFAATYSDADGTHLDGDGNSLWASNIMANAVGVSAPGSSISGQRPSICIGLGC